ncbi:hydrogenase maturation nickel metallochaperone HypA [Planctomycetales bacterium ZRK34]|nr:hydrogenase maturation nickel metallochaperone HypA [Planctomycetales bacterium ZRK34]
MHELSIANELLNVVNENTPPGARVVSLSVQAGAMQAIDADALQFAWQAVTQDDSLEGSRLEVELLPWRLECDQCDRVWESPEAFEPCTCGNVRPKVTGSDELLLVSLDVEQPGEPTESLNHSQA